MISNAFLFKVEKENLNQAVNSLMQVKLNILVLGGYTNFQNWKKISKRILPKLVYPLFPWSELGRI